MLCVLGGVFTRVPGPGYMTYVCRQLLILTDSVTVGGGCWLASGEKHFNTNTLLGPELS